MGVLDIFKSKKKDKAPPKKAATAKAPAKEEKPKTDQAPQAAAAKDTGRAHEILLYPLISEKATILAGSGKYVFAVNPKANKSEIRKSVKKVYDVNVESVAIVKMPGKMRRYGRTMGRTSAWKKAIVKVKEGEKIPGIVESVG